MAAGINDLNDVSAAFLTVALEALAKTDAGAPGRSYVNAGEPAMDCCLPGDALVATERGHLPISEVVAGDRVWSSADGHLESHVVTAAIAKGTQDLLAARCGRRTIRATPDHQILTLRPLDRERNANGTWRENKWALAWSRMDELRPGDSVVALDHLPQDDAAITLPDSSQVDSDLAWLLGLWIGDGCFNGDLGLLWFVHGPVRERACELIKNRWHIEPRRSSERISLNSKEICQTLEPVLTRAKAANKRIPPLIWNGSAEIKRAFLAGYAAADASHSARGYRRYSSASRALVSEARMLHIDLGDAVSNVATTGRHRRIVIKGTPVARALPLHSFDVYPDAHSRHQVILDYRGGRRALPDTQFTISTVRDVVEIEAAPTYDLQVEGVHNFIADGVVVHNCGQAVVWIQDLNEAASVGAGGALGPSKSVLRGSLPQVTIFVQATRCQVGLAKYIKAIEGGDVPDAVDLQATATMVDQDGWALRLTFADSIRNGLLSRVCAGVEMVGGTKLTPQGGCVGWTFSFRYPIEGGKLP